MDALAWGLRLAPRLLGTEQEEAMIAAPEKPIAILVANWQEADVLARMVWGNNGLLLYSNHWFFLGVYPNDTETLQVARAIEGACANVRVVVNSLNGPTSKGQMLNELVRGIFAAEAEIGVRFEAFLMQDSEDILHPLALKLVNRETETTDFLQTPVFSADRPLKQVVGGTYIEEFAELHTKDLLVRDRVGAAIPSAGVGTAIRRCAMLGLVDNPGRDFLREESLTEDYLLGHRVRELGFRSAFRCFYRMDSEGRRDFISTRELFPGRLRAAYRQKSRWIIGIVFQGSAMVPWSGGFWNRYFLWRDRRGPLNSAVAMACTVLTAYLVACLFLGAGQPRFLAEPWFILGSSLATVGAISRAFHRALCVARVNGWSRAWAVAFRWPVGNLINSLATAQAIRQYGRFRLTGEPLKWIKTAHEMPEDFAMGVVMPAPLRGQAPAVAEIAPALAPDVAPELSSEPGANVS